MITIDELHNLGGKPHYMGLGVVKYMFRQNRAYHFYSDKTPAFVDEIHEHRFCFTSTVIKGALKNHIYEVRGTDPRSTLRVERGECKPNAERHVEIHNANVIELCSFSTTEGYTYDINYRTLHRVECLTPKVITLIDKKLPYDQYAPRFITDTTNPSVCAFSQPKSEQECWEIIEYTLSGE